MLLSWLNLPAPKPALSLGFLLGEPIHFLIMEASLSLASWELQPNDQVSLSLISSLQTGRIELDDLSSPQALNVCELHIQVLALTISAIFVNYYRR